MENREDLRSILNYIPLKLQSSTLVWPTPVIEALQALSKGPSHSRVDSGEVFFLAIVDIRNSLSLSSHRLASFVSDGFALFFDEFLSRAEAAKWFQEVVPVMANLLLRLPTLLESHYQYSDIIIVGVETGLHLLESQQAGIVFLSQALRPFIAYYTFELKELENLDQVCEWILAHKWTIGDLWTMLVDYCSKREKGETKLGFISWLVPTISQ